MNTKNLLFKLAGNDPHKLQAAKYWAHTLEFINMFPIELKTEAQAKVLLQFPDADVDICQGAIVLFIHAIDLKEPVFLENAIKLINNVSLGSSDITMLACALDVLTVEARRMLLKSLPNAYSFIDVANKAADYRYKLELYERCDECTYVDNEYRAAWYITCGTYDCCTIEGAWSLKKIKAALKTPERIDRYAQIEHVEYDYSTGCLKEAKEVIEALSIPEFEPIWFKTSEDIANEGSIMRNCIAGYWNDIGTMRIMLACIYKGTRIDLEIDDDSYGFSVIQCFEKFNKTTDTSDELLCVLDDALQLYNLDSIAAKDTSLLRCELCRDAMVLVDTGEIAIDYIKFHHTRSAQIHGANPITGAPVVYKIVYYASTDAGKYYLLKDITGTDEVYPWTEEYNDFEDEDDDFDDYDEAFEPQFLDDYELFD